jgi:hypothetical protein
VGSGGGSQADGHHQVQEGRSHVVSSWVGAVRWTGLACG